MTYYKLTNEIVDERIKNKPIIRIGNIINSKAKIEWRCTKCQYIWNTSPSHILHSNSGCPKCYGNLLLTNIEIDIRLKDRKIQRIDDYINSHSKIRWQCLEKNCNYVWIAAPDTILNQKHGCLKCCNQIRLTNEIIDTRLSNKQFKRIGNVNNNKTKIEWLCLIDSCKNSWLATPHNVLDNGSGCPSCKNKNEKFILKFLNENGISIKYQEDIRNLNNNCTKRCHVDFYLPDHNIIIEYNGKQHYEPVRFNSMSQVQAQINFNNQQNRDNYIRLFCQSNNIKLIEIDGRIYQNKILADYIELMILNNFEILDD
jgi:very-short-patch-repair endonuclease